MALILHNETSPTKENQGPQWSCCGKLFRDGPCGCPKSAEGEMAALKAPEIRSAEALEAIRDALNLVIERLGPAQHQKRMG